MSVRYRGPAFLGRADSFTLAFHDGLPRIQISLGDDASLRRTSGSADFGASDPREDSELVSDCWERLKGFQLVSLMPFAWILVASFGHDADPTVV